MVVDWVGLREVSKKRGVKGVSNLSLFFFGLLVQQASHPKSAEQGRIESPKNIDYLGSELNDVEGEGLNHRNWGRARV